MSYRILLVEDSSADALLIETALSDSLSSIEVVTVERINKASNRLATESFDIVLMDLNLPDGTGLDNLARLASVAPRTPIIVLTGAADENAALDAIQLGAADYLLKGEMEPAVLDRAVRYAIERKKHENDRLELERARIARAEAEAANRAKDEFLATLSHELRTPLNAILGWASLLRTGQLGPNETNQALETIERNARVQAQLIEDLLDVSRIVTGNFRLHLIQVRLGDIVRQAVNALTPVAAEKKVQVALEIKSDPEIRGDSTRLQQVAWNLIANAVKFTPPEGHVWVEVEEQAGPGGEVGGLLRVRDDGQGIGDDFLPQIFDRFRQGDATATRRHGGLGLGLAIVRNVVQMHGGTVTADSKGRGQGSVFTVWIPAVPAEKAREANSPGQSPGPVGTADLETRPRAPSLQGANILVVEDDASAGDYLRQIFGRCGAEVRLAASVPAALIRLDESEWAPDLIVCDLGQPDDDGYALLRQVRAEYPQLRHVPFAVWTAHNPDGEVERAFAAGFAAFWAKPMEPEVLCAAASVLYESTQKKS